MFQIKAVDSIKIRIFSPLKNRAVCEIMSKNMVGPERPQKTWRMHLACWIGKDKHTQAHARACAPTHAHVYEGARPDAEMVS